MTLVLRKFLRFIPAVLLAAFFLFQSSCSGQFQWDASSSGSSTSPAAKNLSGLVSTPFLYPAHFSGVEDIAVVGSGSAQTLFILDSGNSLIRRSNGTTVMTLAGTSGTTGATDGVGGTALFTSLQSLVANSDGDFYFSDGHAVRKLTPSGLVTTLAGDVATPGDVDGLGNGARFRYIIGLTVDHLDNIYVVDQGNHQIRRVTPLGNATKVAGNGSSGSGDGTGTGASFYSPSDIVRDSNGDFFISDTGNHTIRKMTSAGVVTLFAGQVGVSGLANGNGPAATFNRPRGLAIDASDNLYVADSDNGAIRKITPAGDVTTLAGGVISGVTQDGVGADAGFNYPTGLSMDVAGNLFVADNATIRKVTPAGAVTTVAGEDSFYDDNDGVTGGVSIPLSSGITRNIDGNFYLVQFNQAIYRVTPSGEKTLFAGSPYESGNVDGLGSAARFSNINRIVFDSSGNLFVSSGSSAGTIRKITLAGAVSTFAGSAVTSGDTDANGTSARFRAISALAIDKDNNLYVSDQGNSTIRKITSAGDVTTLAGLSGDASYVDGTGAAARFQSVSSLVVGSDGHLYATEYSAHTVRRITPAGSVSTVAGLEGFSGTLDGQGGTARFDAPVAITADGNGNLYVADETSDTVRKIDSSGNVSTLAGSPGSSDYVDGLGASAHFVRITDLSFDKSGGSLYVLDSGAIRIRKID